MAVHLPVLAAERRGVEVVWGVRGARRVVVASRVEGVVAGMALADAQAVRPGLGVVEEDAPGDAGWLRRLGVWAQRFSPLVAVDGGDGLLLDVTGVAHLFGGEEALRARVARAFAQAGVTARVVVAGCGAAAAALARAGVEAVLDAAEEARAVAGLPLTVLGLPEAQVAALHRLGLRRVRELEAQPRGPLARRFGQGLVAVLEGLRGQRVAPAQYLRPPAEFGTARDFLEPILTREAIDACLPGLLQGLCGQLRAAGLGARRLLLRAYRVDGQVQGVVVGTGVASRDPKHFARLFAEKLEKLEPGFGFDRLLLEARVAEPMAGTQGGLPGDGGVSAEARREALAQLLDRLGQRLPVWRLAPRASHWPERGVQRVGPFEAVLLPEGWPGGVRPVRLLRRPVALQAVAMLPDAPPSLLRAGAQSWRVARAEGPERLAPEWWRDKPGRQFRDYYRVELAGGARLWVCRSGFDTAEAPARWYLHGRLG